SFIQSSFILEEAVNPESAKDSVRYRSPTGWPFANDVPMSPLLSWACARGRNQWPWTLGAKAALEGLDEADVRGLPDGDKASVSPHS
ncbi:hypothetical protein, partial [Bradyrhizobium sp. CCBAU 45321]|uniref:hypothetical protein n=1 Tax=Bradyrhizobium sp. CCBAU 45321 TaxID=1641878 RepID=UPI002303EEA8